MISRLIYKTFPFITAFGIFAIVFWFFRATAGFNRSGIGLEGTFIASLLILPFSVFMVAPLLVSIKIIRFKVEQKNKITTFRVAALAFIVISISFIITFADGVRPPRSLGDFYSHDTMRFTDDGLFEYRFERVNVFQRNSRARIFIRDVITEEEQHIYLDIPIILGGGYTPSGNFLWARLEFNETLGGYVLRTNEFSMGRTYINGREFEFNRIRGEGKTVHAAFLIDIENGTSTTLEMYFR